MKLKVGMYVRLGRNQGIAKIDEYDEEYSIYSLDKCIADEWGEETFKLNEKDIIGEPSFNIIDLIEVGDYVNGNEVIQQYKPEGSYCLWIKLLNGESICNSKNIKSIVTKEQFESLKYKVSD